MYTNYIKVFIPFQNPGLNIDQPFLANTCKQPKTHTHTHRHHLGMAPGVQTMFKPPTVELLRSAAQSLHLFLRVPLTEPLHVADLQWPLDR